MYKMFRKLRPKTSFYSYRKSLHRRHPHIVPVVTFVVLLALSGLGFAAYSLTHHSKVVTPDTRIVIISHDHVKQIVPSRESSVGSLLQKLNIKLSEGDRVEPALTTPIDQDQFRVNVYRAVPMHVVDNGQRIFTMSAATTPRSITNQAGINTFPEDNVTTKPAENFLASGSISQEVEIDRATPVNVNLYGAPVVMRTHAKTVRGLLAEKRIKLQPQDMVKPAADVPLAAAGNISIVRNGITTVTVQEEIAPPQQNIPDNTLAYGTTAIRQQGTPGKQAVTYEINTQNGVEVSRKVITTTVVTQPVTQIVVVGASLSGIKGDMALAGIAPGDYQYVDYIVSRESGWCPTKAQGQYGGCPPYAGYVPASGGYGLCQSTPGSKMASAGADWATNPITQLRWCSSYAARTYGGWAGAYNHWVTHHNW
jgi:uncharacterized protein YabE (DUF348 family)